MAEAEEPRGDRGHNVLVSHHPGDAALVERPQLSDLCMDPRRHDLVADPRSAGSNEDELVRKVQPVKLEKEVGKGHGGVAGSEAVPHDEDALRLVALDVRLHQLFDVWLGHQEAVVEAGVEPRAHPRAAAHEAAEEAGIALCDVLVWLELAGRGLKVCHPVKAPDGATVGQHHVVVVVRNVALRVHGVPAGRNLAVGEGPVELETHVLTKDLAQRLEGVGG
mmetsp:Transcript_40938/g.110692  ORF Transcript_40938/g.110692 Transcript_40938/m.110692 type:complete len:221 (+) Transcript_40938:789-1451(+)